MRKILIALSLFCLLFAPDALASQARIDAMGGGVKLLTIDDEVNIFDLPALLLRYPRLALVDNIQGGDETVGLFPNTRFGFHGALGRRFVIALYGGRVNTITRRFGTAFDGPGNPLSGRGRLAVGARASRAKGAYDPARAQQGVSGVPMPSLTRAEPFGTAPSQSLGDVDLKFALLMGVSVGTRYRLGLMLSVLGDYGNRAQPIESGQFQRSALIVDLAFGFGLDLPRFTLDLSVAVSIGQLSHAEDVLSTDSRVADRGHMLGHWEGDHTGVRVVSRAVWAANDTLDVVPYLRLHFGSESLVHQNRNVPIPGGSWSGHDIVFGADLRFKLFDRVTLSPGIGFRFAQQTLKGAGFVDRDMDRLMTLPFYGLAVDIRVLDWLSLRFGASQAVNFHRHSVTPPTVSTTQDEAASVDTRIGTGLGFRIPIKSSFLSLDIHVDPLFWVNGPEFITGAASQLGRWGVSGALRYAW